jgi:predicted CXXCH cytochrome family protein
MMMVAVAVGAAVQVLGCATPEQRHRVLTFFFDGVPPLYPEEPETMLGEPVDGQEPQSLPSRPTVSDASVHPPVQERECGGCHETDRSNRLKAKKEDLCWICHEREDFVGNVVHGPVASGYCLGCHDPHRSDHPFLLMRSPADLCENCHDAFNFESLPEHRLEQGDDCKSCHDPHAAGREYMLKSDEESP